MNRLTERGNPAWIGRRGWWREPRSLLAHFSCMAVLAASGCTTLHTVEPQGEAGTSGGIEPGETVVVSLRDGRELELSFVDWTSAGLTGTDEVGILQKIESRDIARVEVERYSVVRSIGVGVAVLGVAAAAASASGGSGY